MKLKMRLLRALRELGCASVLCLVGIFTDIHWLQADETAATDKPAQQATDDADDSAKLPLHYDPARVEAVFQQARHSLVVITADARDGRQQKLGTGFVISADGLIATNLHVIGQGRPIAVQTADGKRRKVQAVHAADQHLDLAIIRVDGKDLQPLALGDSDAVRQGQPVVALGNPQGLRHSVVAGVVSGSREIDGRKMIQLAIPLEPGNSGGPLLDLDGQVRGIITLKSAVTANLGFAGTVNDLKRLLAKPNPVPIARWVNQGTLDADSWQPVFGAHWQSRGGRVLVDGVGDSFGGRSLCLSKQTPPPVPFVLEVNVRLDDESGAAGLVFAADGGDVHYGFYPSTGDLRLTRFQGPDISSWSILAQRASPAYRRGDWNKLQVLVQARHVTCSVNGQPVVALDVDEPLVGRVGLAKFRDTDAEFRGFRCLTQAAAVAASAAAEHEVDKLLQQFPAASTPSQGLIEEAAANSDLLPAAIEDRADKLARQAEQLRRLSESLRRSRVQVELLKELNQPEDRIDLLNSALWIARLDNEEVDLAHYRQRVDRMAADIAAQLPQDADEAARLAALNKFFFEESGFHGSRFDMDYRHRANSYLNDVLDDREGLPITLSILYIELARRLDLQVEGVGLPGHFVVRYRPKMGEPHLIDVFDGGKIVSPAEAAARVLAATQGPLTDEQLQPASKRAIIVRMLHNLLGVAQESHDHASVMRYLDMVIAVNPHSDRERWTRAVLRWQAGETEGAKQDADWLLTREPAGLDVDRLREFRAALDRVGK